MLDLSLQRATINKMDMPAGFQDLNTLEHVGNMLENANAICHVQPRSLPDLGYFRIQKWGKQDQIRISWFVQSMWMRSKTVIVSGGGHTPNL